MKCFVEFLSIQLQSCEQSIFCDKKLTGDVLTGLKDFAVRFMIRMSKDFATSSLEGEVARENQKAIEFSSVDELQQYQIHSTRQWGQRYVVDNNNNMAAFTTPASNRAEKT